MIARPLSYRLARGPVRAGQRFIRCRLGALTARARVAAGRARPVAGTVPIIVTPNPARRRQPVPGLAGQVRI